MRAGAALAASALSVLAFAVGCAPGLAQDRSSAIEAKEHFRRGLELARQGLHDGAVAEFQAYLASSPNDAEARFQLGRSLIEIALKTKAPLTGGAAELEKSLALDPTRDNVRIQLAEIYARRSPGTFLPDKAVELFEDVLKRHPDRFDVRLRFAQTIFRSEIRLKRRGDTTRVYQDSAWAMDLARHHLEKVIDQAPRDSDEAIEARTWLGEALYRSGEWDAARAVFEYLITGFPEKNLNLGPAYTTIGHTLWRKGSFAAAAEAFRKARDLNPTAISLYDIMLAYDKLGGYPKDLDDRYR
ncbi:MAG TPA: tetratricopeptide repeat protein, partial [Candidatus Polarisedimenticolia bacterium]|nr:tetratricopeptide repeat protein [Candidatus Polarisedimenticolia bacterium]